MKTRILAICVALAISGCAWKSDVDSAKAQLSDAVKTGDSLRVQLADANKTIDDLHLQLSALQSQNEQLSARLAIKPQIPIAYFIRRVLLSRNLVINFTTTVKEPVTVLVTIKKPSLGTVKQYELRIDPAVPAALRDALIESGDVVTVTNEKYSPMTFTIGSQ